MLTKQLRTELYNKLVSRRREILERTHRLKDQWQERNIDPGDLLDKAQQEYVNQNLEKLDEQARKEMHIIDQTLEKMNFEGYGICESCGEWISTKRLQALPWATLCRKCVDSMGSENVPFEESEDKEQKFMPLSDPELQLEIENLSDEELLELVQERIEADGRMVTDELELSCEEGLLYLQGTLPNEVQYNILLSILQDLLPLENIEENLRIETLVRMGLEEEEELDRTDEIDDELLWGEEGS